MATNPKKEKLDNILSKVLKPALTSHYQVEFGLPPSQDFIKVRMEDPIDSNILYDKLTLNCTEASLPGSSLATIDIDNDYHGISEKHAYRRIYDDRMDFTFLVDGENYYVIRLFESWIAYCINEQYTNNVVSFDSSSYTYRVNYPKNYYASSLSIIKFERDYTLDGESKSKNIPLKYQFIQAFPISINSIPVSYEQPNTLKCTVSFSYSRYRVDKFK